MSGATGGGTRRIGNAIPAPGESIAVRPIRDATRQAPCIQRNPADQLRLRRAAGIEGYTTGSRDPISPRTTV